MSDQDQESTGLSRRSLIKRGAIVGGAAVWAAPVVQSFTSPAGAQTAPGSPQCSACGILFFDAANPSMGGIKIKFTQASVDCLCACQQGTTLPAGCSCNPTPQLQIESVQPCGPNSTPCTCP